MDEIEGGERGKATTVGCLEMFFGAYVASLRCHNTTLEARLRMASTNTIIYLP